MAGARLNLLLGSSSGTSDRSAVEGLIWLELVAAYFLDARAVWANLSAWLPGLWIWGATGLLALGSILVCRASANASRVLLAGALLAATPLHALLYFGTGTWYCLSVLLVAAMADRRFKLSLIALVFLGLALAVLVVAEPPSSGEAIGYLGGVPYAWWVALLGVIAVAGQLATSLRATR